MDISLVFSRTESAPLVSIMRNTLSPSHIRKPVLIGIAVVFSLLLLHLIGAYSYMG
jgi:hypothetical protein